MLGHAVGDLVILTVLNLNKQSRLYSQDYRPVFWCASQAEWQPLKLRVTYRREGDDFQLRFCHRFESDEETLFAFAIPFSYQQTQDMLHHLDEQLPFPQYGVTSAGADARDGGGALDSSSSSLEVISLPSPATSSHLPRTTFPLGGTTPGCCSGGADRASAGRPPHQLPRCASEASSGGSSGGGSGVHGSSRLYYRRQLLTRSLEGRRVEVITITDCCGATAETEAPLPGVFEHDPGPPAVVFRDKTVFFVSSRVHPGETPATHMFNGMLAFLLRRSDPRAAALRRRFVFKLVPIVNPDGVAVGNYRTDTLGQNLNRFYTGVPDQMTQPSVYAIKTLLMHYAQQGTLEYYIDLHAHANKKGVFIYGNTLEDCDAHMQSLMYAKLVALNNPAFDFVGCNYTEKNMVRPDKDGASKEGAGRVALYRETGLTHLYTIEANYNTARTLNVTAPASGDHGGRASPPCNKRFPPKFTVGAFHAVGRAILIAALDMEGSNPWSRLPHSEHRSLEGVRSWILTVLRATPETRAAHLPAMSDVMVERLRALILSGALRVSPAFTSAGRARQRPSPHANGDAGPVGAVGYGGASSAGVGPSPVAFSRSVGSTSANIRSRFPPAPLPSRRVNGSLPVIAPHGLHATGGATSASGVAARRGGMPGALYRRSSDGLARSTSLPVKSTSPRVAPHSPRYSLGSALGVKEVATDPTVDEGDDIVAAAAAATAVNAAAEPPCAEGPSDSDGDDDHDEASMRTASPASSSSAAGALAPRFRTLESPLRSSPQSPQPSFKATAVYCVTGRVTEFRFPLASDRMEGSGGFGEGVPRAPAGILGHVNVASRHRPPSAGSSRRTSTSGGAAASAAASPGAAAALAAGGAMGPRHLMLPRSTGTGGAVLITPDQIAVAGPAKSRSALSLGGRSSSANRRNR
ncbi:hypothetical protein PLESTB_001479400 [Pleodorina starrii]|uniref:tubulin-glutamate carboxypeptidase n=1 Tax=Pleodorina starrii TaxID=330485 RepID=A0A9W6BWH4_9CHLO|nr:hypothetical protein PLESTB_001479400 [Pleodorina starrii]GLC74428.1 hypothetical protein PLESTF_001511900 [Pleodorina starrii]